MEALLRRLWLDLPPDPADGGWPDDYAPALERARLLVRLGLPCDLGALRARWPWSVDLAWLEVEASGDTAPLEATVRAQRRRWGTLAWALWSRGAGAAALGVFPAGDLSDDDRHARAELRILSDLDAEPLPGPRGAHLSLLATWRHDGGAALAARADLEGAALPAHPPLWSWLVETFLHERDHARARALLAAFAARCPDHPDVAALRIRLAIEGEDMTRARALLDSLGAADRPWTWGARRHVLHLRCLSDEIAAGAGGDYGPLRAAAEAALRLFPRHGGLQGLALNARLLTGDGDTLAAALDRHPDPRAAAGALLALGLPDRALAVLDRAPPSPPDEMVRTRLRRAEAHLRRGALAEARAALGPEPVAAPLAADHAWWAAEIALAARDLPAARAALEPALARHPTRMGLILSAARLAFLAGDPGAALAHLARFRALKTAQLGKTPPDDLRDRIVVDAATSPDGPGQAARALATATPPFRPVDGPPIPRRIAHYWEGPRSAGVERGLRAWARLCPQQLFDPQTARDWLAAHTALAPLFDRLTQPATRADLFRVAYLAREGGLYADLDEYPRAPLDDWLTGAAAVLVIEEGHGTLANNFLAARPGLPLLAALQDRIAANLHSAPAPYPWWDSGPAPLTLLGWRARAEPGLRFLTQPEYDARIATNLPFPHKRGPGHWR